VADLCRTHGITEQTYYRWKAKYGGLELSEMQRLKQLEDENRRLKQIVAEQSLDLQAMKAVIAKSGRPRREARRGGVAARGAGNESPASVSNRRPEHGHVAISAARTRGQHRAAGAAAGACGGAGTVWVSPAAHAPHPRGTGGESQRPGLDEARAWRERSLAGWTGLEPAASGVTGRRSNQLNYHPKVCRSLVRLKPDTTFFALRRRALRVIGRYRTRTCDGRRVKPVLYQLS
jgi:putative transposase